MRLAKKQLKQIIKEELASAVNEWGKKTDPGDEFVAAVRKLIEMATQLNRGTKDQAIREMTSDVYKALKNIPGI